ncbi:MAG TPA: ATP-dependent DNA helicase, partial [Candidatus Krumholzibacteria bacterium]|nr:ATP-dependent DNA helicase [Candidatus Krumholzibacteria bacterium]
EWQRLSPEDDVEGPEGLSMVVEQLDGFEAAAAAWESEILPARVADYDPSWLDSLCLSGRCTWARLSPARTGGRDTEAEAPVVRGRGGPVRTTPIALLQRSNLRAWPQLETWPEDLHLSPEAQGVYSYLQRRGASFFAEIASGTRLLRTQVEAALGELVSQGLVSADSFMGLRALLVPSERRKPLHDGGRRRRAVAHYGVEDAGRWGILRTPQHAEAVAGDGSALPLAVDTSTAEAVAPVLLRRWGIVFRKLVEREPAAPPWRELLAVLRRLEARGEIRGGRFVDGFSGEQFALPEAVGTLRQVRKSPRTGAFVAVSGADPLNLVGVLTPGARVPVHTDNRVLYRDGVPLAVRVAGEIRLLEATEDGTTTWEIRQALVRRRVPPQLRRVLRFA